MNWFQRHLNWTLVLAWTVFNLFAVVYVGGDYAGFIVDLYRAGGVGVVQLYALFGFVVVAAYLFVCGWVLKRKSRSLWWLLILVVPFGFIVFLCLKNKTLNLT